MPKIHIKALLMCPCHVDTIYSYYKETKNVPHFYKCARTTLVQAKKISPASLNLGVVTLFTHFI